MRTPCGVCGIDSWSQVEADRHTACRAIADRRQRALKAAYDARGGADYDPITEAIETATRVRITDEAVAEFGRAWHDAPQDGPPGTRRRAALAAALRELGFEVEE